jgi:hypothetical protein
VNVADFDGGIGGLERDAGGDKEEERGERVFHSVWSAELTIIR